MENRKKLLVVHPAIATYRIDLFNSLWNAYDTKVCLNRRYLLSQPEMTIDSISKELKFQPTYLEARTMLGKCLLLCKELWGNKYDLVLVSECGLLSITVLIFRFLFNRQYKVISILDDSYDMAANGNQFSWKHKLGERICIPFFEDIICVEPRVTKHFQIKYSKGYTFPIIRNDIKVRKNLSRALSISEEYVQKYNLKGQQVVLFVGRLVEIKNPHGLIEAFKRINRPNTKLIIVGNGVLEHKVKDYANCANIIITGRLSGDELLAWYNVADIFCLPSFIEPFGAVTNEALLAGCFSIISKYAGSQCLVEEGVNGLLIDPFQPESIDSALNKAFESTICTTKRIKLKDNLMRINYEKEIDHLITHLNYLIIA